MQLPESTRRFRRFAHKNFSVRRLSPGFFVLSASICVICGLSLAGCSWRDAADRDVNAAIRERQQRALASEFPVKLNDPHESLRPHKDAYDYAPGASSPDIP